ncbi:MAG: hypothetical protein M1833_000018 [Piccolia ochrophora]|nr:MAG: hypothetical protein M1833_000018 [Piccolia ochrophora]
MATFRERLAHLTETEKEKDRLIQELLDKVEQLDTELQLSRADLERCEDSARYYQGNERDLKVQLRHKQAETDRNAFVLVLIDGDGMNFCDELVQAGDDGGKKAASLLMNFVSDYIQHEDFSHRHDIDVVVRIYANLKGLRKTYQDARILEGFADIEPFVRGFNHMYPLFDFCDASNGKECSDRKLQRVLNLFIKNVHCKHIFFGGSTDNGYARDLVPCSTDKSLAKRITLLEGPPFARELLDLKKSFSNASIPGLFRSQKIPTRKVSFSITPPKSPSPSYASAIAHAGPANGLPVAQPTKVTQPAVIRRNKADQRIDPQPKVAPAVITEMKHRKLCNQYHLQGACPFAKCLYIHGQSLDDRELEGLRAVARLSACSYGVYCEDEFCIAGHRCCKPFCEQGKCHFPAQMHGIDTTVVKT